ncbi:hypothetical protein ASE35_09225 [Lysobacter sp. Root916]|uniref:hypothetical protein n=1 Tax=Lysobacter sp. Root916 TaxID=1736606 RepID=UPI00070B676B|nr:hypothetical protein [Lysobacter sp. Root916]KRD34898.1 hypothetical protein ASE35_09225 [Lysobacter sp. Root916]
MQLSLPAMTPILATAGIGWIYYRRIRSQFGRQAYRPRRALVRLTILSVAMLALIFGAVMLPHVWPGVLAGSLIGAAIGVFALRHTHVEPCMKDAYYTPNPWIGGALSLLLIGRLAWRWAGGAFSSGMPTSQASPLTMAIAATLVGYYLVYGIGLRRQIRRPAADAAASAIE